MWRFHIVLLLLVSSLVVSRGFRGGGRGGGGRGGGYGGGRSRNSGSHTYPSSNGYSGTGTGGSHKYPYSTGYSGNNRQSYGHHTEVHHHYHYSPPQHISYGGVSTHPVYSAPPPVYVYQYRDSGSRFNNLLAGLALYNLGRMSATSSHYRYDASREYRSKPGEICKLVISKDNGEYEETRIDCKLMSSFILEAEPQNNNQQVQTITTVNVTHGANGDTTTTTVVDALQVKGPSLKVTPGMNCYIIRISSDTSMLKKNVECGLLQAYAVNSLHYSSGERLVPSLTIFVYFFMVVLNFVNV